MSIACLSCRKEGMSRSCTAARAPKVARMPARRLEEGEGSSTKVAREHSGKTAQEVRDPYVLCMQVQVEIFISWWKLVGGHMSEQSCTTNMGDLSSKESPCNQVFSPLPIDGFAYTALNDQYVT
jgi:hypothetical protein